MKMKFKLFCALFVSGVLGASAQQGYMDGVEYYRADQPEEAEIILNNTYDDITTDKSTASYYLGQIALQKGDILAAKQLFNAGIVANPENGLNYVGLGAAALAEKNYNGANDYFKQARSRAKKNAEVLTEIGRAYYKADPVLYSKEITKAIADAKKADKTSPAPYILEADILAPTNVGEAAGYYEMAAQFDTNMKHPEAYVKYARTYFPVNPSFAINKLKELLERQPQSALAQRELAEKYYDNDQLTRAAEQYSAYIQNPNHFQKDEIRHVALLFFGKKYQDSYDMASKILKKDPENFYMQRMQFYNKMALEDYAGAKKAADALFSNAKAEYTPNDYTQYGQLLQELGQDTLAVVQFEKAVTMAPDKVDLLKELSAAYSSAKMYDRAAATLQQYIDGGNGDANDLLMLARRYQNLAVSSEDPIVKENAIGKALATINKVIEIVPDNPLVLNTKSAIIRIANNNEMNDDALAVDMQTLSILDSDPVNKEKRKDMYVQIFGRLGNYYFVNGDLDNARSYFERFYELSPSDDLRTFIDTKLVSK